MMSKPSSKRESELDAARTIRSFLNGTGGQWDWDDFLSIPCRSHKGLEAIRAYANHIYDKYPAGRSGAYCNDEGLAELARIAEMLERGDDIAIDRDGVPHVHD